MFNANGTVSRAESGYYCLVASITGKMVISAKTEDLKDYLVEVRYGIVASIINNLARKADVDVMSQLYREGVVSQTITYNSDGTRTLSNVKRGIIPMASINQWVAAGALFNDTQNAIERNAPWGEKVMHLPGYFYLNGLGDISSEEMERVYNLPKIEDIWKYGLLNSSVKGFKEARTHFDKPGYGVNIDVTNIDYGFRQLPVTEVLWGANTRLKAKMQNDYAPSLAYCVECTNAFVNFYGNKITLKHLYAKGLKSSFSANNIPNLTLASILYMIQNAANGTTDITITLHHDAYMRAIADTDIQAALEANGHITLACATHSDEKYPTT